MPYDAASDVRASRRLRPGVLLGVMAGVEAAAVMGWRVAGPPEVPASPLPAGNVMPSDSESHWTRSLAARAM